MKLSSVVKAFLALTVLGVAAPRLMAADPPANPPQAEKSADKSPAPSNAPTPTPSDSKSAADNAAPRIPSPSNAPSSNPTNSNPAAGKPAAPSSPSSPNAPSPTPSTPGAPNTQPQPGAQPPAPNAGQPANNRPTPPRTFGDRNRPDDRRDDARDNRDDRRNDNDRNADQNRNRPEFRRGPTPHQTNRALTTDANRGVAAGAGVRSNANLGLAFGTGVGAGLVINSIAPGGFFANAGFQPGDQIVSVGGQRFNNQGGFYSYLYSVQPGQRIPFVVLRNGQQQTLYWTPTQEFTQQISQSAPAGPGMNFLGIILDEQVDDAAMVANVEPNSPAYQAGVRPNDMIVGINDQHVQTRDDFVAAASNLSGGPVDLHVSRTMSMHIVPTGNAQQTTSSAAPGPPSPPQPAVTPVPANQPQAAPQQAPARRGLFRRR